MIAYGGNNRGRALRIAVGITMLVLFLVNGANAAFGNSQTFTWAGTQSWTVPAGVTTVYITAWGGGGEGGRSPYSDTMGSTGGGGSGEVMVLEPIAITPGTSYTIQVGAGGTGCTTNSYCWGNTGGTTTFGTLISVAGGIGGGYYSGGNTVGGNGGGVQGAVGTTGTGSSGTASGNRIGGSSGGGATTTTPGNGGPLNGYSGGTGVHGTSNNHMGGGAAGFGGNGANGAQGGYSSASSNSGAGGGGVSYNSAGEASAGGSGKLIIYWNPINPPVHNINNGIDYPTIQSAINDADPGDEIHVDSGAYYENVNVNKQLILKGVDTGVGKPVVDAQWIGSAITLAADGIVLEGFTATEVATPNVGIKVTSSNNTLRGNNVSNLNYDGIYLDNSSNNTLSGNNLSNNYDGIYLDNSSNNTLSGNNLSNNYKGVYLDNSSNNTLSGNNVSNNYEGINLIYSSNNTLSGNNVSNQRYGIRLDNSSNNMLSWNNVLKHHIGILLVRSSNNNMLSGNNAISNTLSGILNQDSSNNTLSGNNASNSYNGILNEYSNNNTLSGNNVSNNNNLGINLVSSSNNTLSGNNVSNNSNGIYLDFYSNNNTLIGNNANSNKRDGFLLRSDSNNNILSGNNASSNNQTGIRLIESSNNNMLSENNANSNNWDGISQSSSNNNTLRGNNANSNNQTGIYIYSSSNNTLNENNANSNKRDGIYVLYSKNNTLNGNNANSNNMRGIYLYSSNNNTLNGNNANSNNQIGIYLYSSSNNNTLNENNASLNNGYGIGLYSSSKNKIFNNIFNNTNNFYFNGSNIETWNIIKQSGTNIIGGSYLGGNFWAYPNGTGYSQTCFDENVDGICDTPYVLNANNTDFLPLAVPDTTPPASLISLINITFAQTYINWTWTDPADIDFNHVEIYLDGIQKPNVLAGVQYYNATGLTASTIHEISTRTVDNSGNVNATWNNHTSTTALIPDNPLIIAEANGPYSGNVNSVISLSGSATCGTGSYTSYSWTVSSGGVINSGQGTDVISVTWGSAGTKTVSLTVTDSAGNTGTDTATVTVYPLPDTSAPASVIGLTNITYAQTYINWTWADPADIDFNHVEVYLDGIQKPNVLAGVQYYNATGLTANTTHEISTRTVDNSGNVNATWNNHTAITASLPDTTAPASVTDLHNISYAFNYINWTWTEPSDADFAKVMVYLDGVYKNDVLKGVNYYNAIVSPGTYTIGTRTVDTDGNINATMVTHTATTILPQIRFINGTVMDSVSKAVISGATVSTGSFSNTSNTTGFYSLAVDSGSYNLTATLDIRYYTNSSITVSTIGNAVVVQDIELVKKPMGTITGSVTRGT